MIACVLLDPASHAGKTYSLFGAEELDHEQIAKIVGDALGRPVRYEPESLESFEARLGQIGLSAHFVQHITSVYRGYQAGEFAGTNDVVEQITGRKPVSVRDYVIANRGIFQPAPQR
ncbi:hypothetical protein SAMN05192564_107143 [Paraburkholderia sartisoli]|uniref:NmrA-like family protein n=1 Tax=Paraburkholderia sartisoli TaxID=83784 RepID=A0A1H4H316_9BURK|nr:hypothetical protein SAMN05192564_107143 [Paraburkholderia sartisoli]